MDYKKIIRNRGLRLKILQMFSFVPDSIMLRFQYKIKTGHKLDLRNPQRFSEKLQWYKLNYKDPSMIKCVDKYDVREYVRSKGLEDILIPCYGVYNSAEEIEWEALPDQFVIKDTLGVGGNSVIIVRNKKDKDINKIKKSVRVWTSENAHKKSGGREWPYYSGKNHRIIIEKYIDSDPEKGGLIDYKFFCFNGRPQWMYVIADRIVGNDGAFGIYDMSYKKSNVKRDGERSLERDIPKPAEFELMKEIAARLSKDFPEARIDLYDSDGKVYFGEITFYSASGYLKFDPDSFDYELGKLFVLPRAGRYFER